jgi:hypothetical protein
LGTNRFTRTAADLELKEILDVKNLTIRRGGDDAALVGNNLADKKGLKGADRKSSVKECMKKANPL